MKSDFEERSALRLDIKNELIRNKSGKINVLPDLFVAMGWIAARNAHEKPACRLLERTGCCDVDALVAYLSTVE